MEFALVLPILMLIVMGIMQFGLIFWGQITLSQIARDAGRWAATQTLSPCSNGVAAVQNQVTTIADRSSLFAFPGNPVNTTVTWTLSSGGGACPPPDNQTVWYVNIDVTHVVPIFLPLVADTCTPTCTRTLGSSVQYRMEPAP